ncbi:hypothetical protein MACJ_003870 [Theileria orientalis]|nr:hypothetical protein MACJ_003870 [Theileria orientalis]
MIDGPRP